MPSSIDQQVTLGDGRVMWFDEYGDPNGIPFMAMHGTPGSRRAGRLFDQAGREGGLRIIAPERPGCGRSSPRPGTMVADFAQDVDALADWLKLGRFSVLGISGGAPYALACAAKLPDRLAAAGIVSGVGPLSLPGGVSGMMAGNAVVFSLARYAPGPIAGLMAAMNRSMMGGVLKQARAGKSPMPGIPPEIVAMLIEDQIEAVAVRSDGMAIEFRNLWRSWGFEFEDIKPDVYLWHGEKDSNAPVGLARQVAARMPKCHATFYPDDDHMSTWLNHSGEIVGALIEAARRQ